MPTANEGLLAAFIIIIIIITIKIYNWSENTDNACIINIIAQLSKYFVSLQQCASAMHHSCAEFSADGYDAKNDIYTKDLFLNVVIDVHTYVCKYNLINIWIINRNLRT